MTARRVAAQRLSFDRVPCPWSSSSEGVDADQRLQADVAAGLVVPPTAMTRYLQARTQWFDAVVVRSLDPTTSSPVDQAVAVGAGYDGRSLRYAREGATWFELDHPETQADKRARLDRLGIDTSAVRFAAADFLSDDVGQAATDAGLDAGRPSLLLCEGVAGYLGIDAASALLVALGTVSASGSRLAVTLPLEPETETERERRDRLDRAVTSMGEPLASAIPRRELTDRLAATGWHVRRATDPAGVDLVESTRSSAFVIAVAA